MSEMDKHFYALEEIASEHDSKRLDEYLRDNNFDLGISIRDNADKPVVWVAFRKICPGGEAIFISTYEDIMYVLFGDSTVYEKKITSNLAYGLYISGCVWVAYDPDTPVEQREYLKKLLGIEN